MFVQRDAWRLRAEQTCIGSGSVKQGPGLVRISPINGPGVCGAQYPLKVAQLGQRSVLGYAETLRPPAAIPGASSPPQPRWPVREPRYAPPPTALDELPPDHRYPQAESGQPLSLEPPPGAARGQRYQPYDFRRPYEATTRPPTAPPNEDMPARAVKRAPIVDMSPEPYVGRRPLTPPTAAPDDEQEPDRPTRARRPVPPTPVVPLGPTRAPPATGAFAAVTIKPTATLACPLVSVLDRWIADDIQPAAMRWFGQPVAEIKQISAYSCRGMNGNPRARISEHAFGNALDIAAFVLADGRTVTVKKGWRGAPEEQGFLRDVQGAACERFHTVLAPGSNRFHYDHFHVDLMRRSGGRRACNPSAVSGEVVAARARARLAGRRGSDPAVTGSIAKRRGTVRAFAEPDEARKLPLAEPGNDDLEEKDDEEEGG